MNKKGCPNDGGPQKKRRTQACATKATQSERKTDCHRWLDLVGFQAFMDLKKREDRSLMALNRDNGSIPHINSDVLRMLMFPTSCERLLEWLRAECGKDFERMEIKELKVLNLSNNNLTSLPKEIGNLKQLLQLFLYDNKLTSLPKEIGDLNQLEVLNVRNNQLTSVPKEIGDLKQLKELDLGDNQLTSVPTVSDTHLRDQETLGAIS